MNIKAGKNHKTYMAFKKPVLLEDQGSFMAGGTVVTRSGDFTKWCWLFRAGLGDNAGRS